MLEIGGVLVSLRDGATIKGYAIWNDGWATLGYSSYIDRRKDWQASLKRIIETRKPFPAVIFDPAAQIRIITVYTNLRSTKYPVAKGLVTLRDPVEVHVQDIKDLKLNPGIHDGYQGAGGLPLVSERIADLLQTSQSLRAIMR